MKPSACGLRLAVVNDVWDNGVTDVTIGVIAQGVIMLHHACLRVPCNGTMLMPSGPYAPRPRLPSITVGSQALQNHPIHNRVGIGAVLLRYTLYVTLHQCFLSAHGVTLILLFLSCAP